jgi:predicted esterase
MRTRSARLKHMPVISLLVMYALSTAGRAAQITSTEELKPGRVIERVACKNNSEQTYALYLPSSYSPDRRWPLMAAFDPGARGNVPVEHFKEAAERYGFIVCGSNNSRNGPMAPTGEAAKAMLGDVDSRFAIDGKRVYLTGFSGGARAATTLAVRLTGQVAGVIGCGAGLAEGLAPSSSLPFIYYGTVGNEDFNYPEMKQLDRALDSASVTHHVEMFEGGHSWAPADVCARAVEWMELQAMKTGRRARDDSFIDRAFKNGQDAANASETADRIYDAYRAYASIAVDFKGLRDVVEIEKKAALLKDSKAVKQAINKEREQDSEQRRRVSELFGLRARLTTQATKAALGGGSSGGVFTQRNEPAGDSETRKPIISDLKGMLSDLKRKSEAKESTQERALARRVLNQFTVASFEQSMILIRTMKYDLAVANLATDTEIMPDNWRVWYNLACAYALNGDKRHAIEALNNSIRKGFVNASEIENNHQLDSIRNEAGFKKIVEELTKPKT